MQKQQNRIQQRRERERKQKKKNLIKLAIFIVLVIGVLIILKPIRLIKVTLDKRKDNTVYNIGEESIVLYPINKDNIDIDSETGQKYVNNEMVLIASDGVSEDNLFELVKDYGGSVAGYIKAINQYQVVFDSSHTYDELIEIAENLSNNNSIENAIPNVFLTIDYDYYPDDKKWKNEWNDTPGGKNWGVEAIGAPEMWEISSSMETTPVKVGVLDDQFFTAHEDLEYKEVFLNNFNNNSNHGTHVSGTIAALHNDKGIAGLSRENVLYGASMEGLDNREVKTNSEGVTVSEYEAGLTYLIAIKNCRVINLSYGGGFDDLYVNYLWAQQIENCLRQFIDEGYEFLISKAAGNDRMNYFDYDVFAYIDDPVVLNHIITVGSAKLVDDKIYISEFSNYGDMVDIIAPGSEIYSTTCVDKSPFALFSLSWGWYDSDYGMMNGTSMAAPHVTGVAAEIWSVNPYLKGDEVKQIICSSATGDYYYEPYENQKTVYVNKGDKYEEVDINSSGIFRSAYSFSYPMLNASNAMKKAVNTKNEESNSYETIDNYSNIEDDREETYNYAEETKNNQETEKTTNSVLSGTYVHYAYGLIRNEFTFYDDYKIELNSMGVNGSGTYEISGDSMIIKYITSVDNYAETYTWNVPFEYGENGSIIICGDEFVKE